MESLDKNSLNTEIVQLRHDVQRVKTLVLRNLARKADQLRSKKGKEEIRLRNEKKAERLLQEIHEVKKIKPDAVTKFAIKNSEKDCLKTIANVEAPINVKCLARVACEKSFVLKMKKLEDKYYNWQDAATFLLPVKKVKKKKIKTKKEVSTVAEEAVSESDSSEEDGSSDDSEPGEEPSSDVVDSDVSEEEEDESEPCYSSPAELELVQSTSTSTTTSKVKENSKSKNLNNEESSLTSSVKTPDKKVKPPKQNNAKSTQIIEKTNESCNVAVVRKIRNLEDLEHMEHKNNSLKSSSVAEARKDSFFLSADGEEVESEPEEEGSSEDGNSDEDLDTERNKVYHGRGKEGGYERRKTFGALNNQETYGKQTKSFNQKQPQLKRFDSKPQAQRPPANKGKGNVMKDMSIPKEKTSVSDKLHPSWEAKRKLKESLQISNIPQNKKIKFDD